jgi:hypothetical protein
MSNPSPAPNEAIARLEEVVLNSEPLVKLNVEKAGPTLPIQRRRSKTRRNKSRARRSKRA